jgi:hypothetical protein
LLTDFCNTLYRQAGLRFGGEMENMHKVILFLLMTSFSISAQENKSIHRLEHRIAPEIK